MTKKNLATEAIGKQFGRLFVLDIYKKDKKTLAYCMCECGNTAVIIAKNVRNKHTKSCGCLGIERRKKFGLNRIKHGHSPGSKNHSTTYNSWHAMLARCENPSSPSFNYYGAKGIKVCDNWRTSYITFLNDMGERPPGTSLDRIDNSKGYFPENCRWSNRKNQALNRVSTKFFKINGQTKCLADWVREYKKINNVSYTTVRERLSKGWNILAALTTPTSYKHKKN